MSQPTVCCIEHQIRTQPRGYHGRVVVKVASRDGLVFCNDCKEFKEPSAFQERRGNALSPCKACRAKRCQAYVAEGRRQSKPNVIARRRAVAAWATRNRDKVAAHNAVQYALRSGKLKRSACEQCGNSKSQAHHEDYSQKLKVKWLCVVCHKKEHRRYV